MNRQDSGGVIVDESEDIVVCESTTEESHLPAVAFEQVRHDLGAKLLQLLRSTADDHPLAPSGPARQFVLQLVHDRAIDSRGQMLLDRRYFVGPPQFLDFQHDWPDDVDINGVGRYAALQGFLNNCSAGSSIAPKQRFQIAGQDVLLYHSISLQYSFRSAMLAYYFTNKFCACVNVNIGSLTNK